MPAEVPDELGPPVTSLGRKQRRVLGVLVEKGFTTPEAYPLTLKATTSGCNQKSNRDPVVEYSEDEVAETLEQLRGLGLVAEVHTESGRTSRFRHYMRRKFTLTEPQLAILTELLLRGRQQLGELRTRASRMAAIDTLEQLRDALIGLQQLNLVQANGPLERRGCEVDHNLYHPREGGRMEPAAFASEAPVIPSGEWEAAVAPPHLGPSGGGGATHSTNEPAVKSPMPSPSPAAAATRTAIRETEASSGGSSSVTELANRLSSLEAMLSQQQLQNREILDRVETVEAENRRLSDLLDSLTR